MDAKRPDDGAVWRGNSENVGSLISWLCAFARKEVAVKTKRSPISYLFIVGVQALTLSYAELSPRRAEAAYDYNISQIAPVNLTMTQIAAILNHTAPSADAPNTPYLNAYQQTTTTDATGAIVLLAPVKVVQTDDPNHPYLGVFHNQVTTTKFATYAAYSLDLFKWHTLGAIDDVALNEYGTNQTFEFFRMTACSLRKNTIRPASRKSESATMVEPPLRPDSRRLFSIRA